MGLLGALFGRGGSAHSNWAEALGALSQAATFIQNDLETLPQGQAGLIVQPDDDASHEDASAKVTRLLENDETLSSVRYRIQPDKHLHAWVILESKPLEDLTESLWKVAESLKERGMEDRLLAAVFPFTWQNKPLYWLLRISTGRFTPFVPVGQMEDEERDHPLEIRMEKALRKTIPTARSVKQWYPLWGIPI